MSRSTWMALACLAGVVLAALAAPALNPNPFDRLDWAHVAEPPSLQGAHWFGTDRLGRDIFVRTFAGTRISLAVAVLASLVSLVIGTLYGATSGFLGGRTDHLMMRGVEILSGLPLIFFIIFLTVLFGRSVLLLFSAIGAVGWLTMARIARAQASSVARKEYVEAARVAGARRRHVLWQHVLPNIIGPLMVYAALIVPQTILLESFLSFLGLGVQEPHASLGTLIAEGAGEIESGAWMLLFPGGILALLLLCLNVLGDAARDALTRSAA